MPRVRLFIKRRISDRYLLRTSRYRQKTHFGSEPFQDLESYRPSSEDYDLQNQQQQSEQLVISVQDKMNQALRDGATTNWDKLWIYRVPLHLQENDKKSYFPQTVSLGPYHRNKEHLLPMEFHKWRAVKRIMERKEHDIGVYIDAMKELEEKARACYQGPIGLNTTEFTEMLVLDGCFVLELFRGTMEGFQKIGYERNDPVFAMRGLMHSIQLDMVMLENQLPLFVLDRLLEVQRRTPTPTGLVAQVAVQFFDRLMATRVTSPKQNSPGDSGDLHCLDVFRRSHLQFSRTPTQRSEDLLPLNLVDKRQQQLVHCVTELREAGVKFRTRQTYQFGDIRFENGCLEIPKLLIHDGTKSLFSNLIAFEQCHIGLTNDITSYIIFMYNLIKSSEDVSYLHYCGIIEHWLGSDAEVADLFNRLCQEVFFDPDDSYLSQLSKNVNAYYDRKWKTRKWNTWKATLKHKYFNNPWAYFSFFAAVILLVLTFVQSFYAVYAYYKPSS